MPTHLSNLLMAQDKCSYFTILNYTVVKDSAIAQCRKNIKFTTYKAGMRRKNREKFLLWWGY